MYDYPYRLELDTRTDRTVYQVLRTGEGVICQGENFSEMHKLVEAANDMAAIEQGDRGR